MPASAIAVAAFVIAIAGVPLVPASADQPSPEPPAAPSSEMTSESACASIRAALHNLAEAERNQAFALDLESGGHGRATAMVEAALSGVLDRTDTLRAALRTVRQSAVARDPGVEQCMEMGFRSLVEAESLTTSVEQVLYGPDLSRQAPPLRSDAGRLAPPVPKP